MIDYLFSKNVKEECINFLKEYLSLNEEDQKNYASEKLNCLAKDIDYPIDFTDLTVVRVKNIEFRNEKIYNILKDIGVDIKNQKEKRNDLS